MLKSDTTQHYVSPSPACLTMCSLNDIERQVAFIDDAMEEHQAPQNISITEDILDFMGYPHMTEILRKICRNI